MPVILILVVLPKVLLEVKLKELLTILASEPSSIWVLPSIKLILPGKSSLKLRLSSVGQLYSPLLISFSMVMVVIVEVPSLKTYAKSPPPLS